MTSCKFRLRIPTRMYEPQIESGEEARLVAIVREAGEISRLELAQRSGLGRNKVSATLKSLLDQHFLEEVGTGASSGGRPPSRVRFAKESGYLIGIDLGATSLDVAVTNLNAEPICHLSREIDVRDGPDAVMSAARSDVERALDESGLTRQSLKGIGMGIPGPVEFATGRPVSPPIMPGWHLFPIREYLEGEFGCPVFVDNDVNMMITGERWAGAGRDAQNFIFVKLGSGIGCGIVSHGKIYRGAQGSAGDIGHIAVGDDPTVCRCGNLGCLEFDRGRMGAGEDSGAAGQRTAQRNLGAALEGVGGDRGRPRSRTRRRRSRGRRDRSPVGTSDWSRARQPGELLQPRTDRHRRRCGENRGPSACGNPRSHLSTLASARNS